MEIVQQTGTSCIPLASYKAVHLPILFGWSMCDICFVTLGQKNHKMDISHIAAMRIKRMR